MEQRTSLIDFFFVVINIRRKRLGRIPTAEWLSFGKMILHKEYFEMKETHQKATKEAMPVGLMSSEAFYVRRTGKSIFYNETDSVAEII